MTDIRKTYVICGTVAFCFAAFFIGASYIGTVERRAETDRMQACVVAGGTWVPGALRDREDLCIGRRHLSDRP